MVEGSIVEMTTQLSHPPTLLPSMALEQCPSVELLGPPWAPNLASTNRGCPLLPLQASSGSHSLLGKEKENRSPPPMTDDITWEPGL